MIRRTFLKALCASPLGFLVPKTRSGTRKLVGEELAEAENYVTLTPDGRMQYIGYYANEEHIQYSNIGCGSKAGRVND